MYDNLRAEMAREHIGNTEIAKAINKNDKTVRNKMHGITLWLFDEAVKIRDTYFPTLKLEYLFAKTKSGIEEGNNQG